MTAAEPGPLVTDDDVHAALAAGNLPATEGTIARMRLALTAAAPAMRDRWLADLAGRLDRAADRWVAEPGEEDLATTNYIRGLRTAALIARADTPVPVIAPRKATQA